jgi:hypothetical protein
METPGKSRIYKNRPSRHTVTKLMRCLQISHTTDLTEICPFLYSHSYCIQKLVSFHFITQAIRFSSKKDSHKILRIEIRPIFHTVDTSACILIVYGLFTKTLTSSGCIALSRNVKVKFAPEQATMAHRGLEIWLYSFFDLGARWEWVVNAMPRPRYPRGRPGTHCIGDQLGRTDCQDGCGKSRPPPAFDPRTVRPVPSRYPGPHSIEWCGDYWIMNGKGWGRKRLWHNLM